MLVVRLFECRRNKEPCAKGSFCTRRWIGNSIAATQPGGRPGVVRKQVTASNRLKRPTLRPSPVLGDLPDALAPDQSAPRAAGPVAYAARGARAPTSPSQRARSLGSPPSMCLSDVKQSRRDHRHGSGHGRGDRHVRILRRRVVGGRTTPRAGIVLPERGAEEPRRGRAKRIERRAGDVPRAAAGSRR